MLSSIKNIEKIELDSIINNNKFILIDVRDQKEIIETGMITKDAKNIPLKEISESLKLDNDDWKKKYGFDKPTNQEEKFIIFSCRSGKRSLEACKIFSSYGINCMNYTGGANEWFINDLNKKNNM